MAVLVTPPQPESASPALGNVTTRPAVATDSCFLLELYASAYQDELDTIGWSIGSQRTFVIMQAQTREWELIRRHPQLDRLTICVDGVPAGRMLVSRTAIVIHLIDVCLLPVWRGRGIGTRLVKELLEEAAAAEVPMRVRVPKESRVAAVCIELGFTEPLDCGTEWLLTRRPPDGQVSDDFQGGRLAGSGIGHRPAPVHDDIS